MRIAKYLKFIGKWNIDSLCSKYEIENYTINDDGSVDVNGSVDISYRQLTQIPLFFRNITGIFDCANNRLTSLEGSPTSVGGDFWCNGNRLTSLKGGPMTVGLNMPSTYGNFHCYDNQITSLIGGPVSVNGGFDCGGNNLTTLEGCPKSIGEYFYCKDNNLVDVRGIKDGWRGVILISENPVEQIFKMFQKKGESPGITNIGRFDEVVEYINEFDVIRDGKVVVLQALEQVFVEMGMEIPEIENIDGYEII